MFSENIFKDIEKAIFKKNACLSIRDEHANTIKAFLSSPTQKTASELFSFIKLKHDKESVFKLMEDLKLYEDGALEILPDHRDHFVHSASVYVLGLAIYNSSSKIRSALSLDRHEATSDAQKSSFLFRWSMAACLHDIAYPLEIALKSFNKYSEKLYEKHNKTKKSHITIDQRIYTDLNLLRILNPHSSFELERRDTGLGLIAENLTREKQNWRSPISYGTLLDLMKRYLDENLLIGRVDHGVFSALVMLNRVHKLYEDHPWELKGFYYEVVDAATAIFLHNSYRHSQIKNIFGNGQYKYDFPNSLGFLLYLSDTFCEWLRSGNQDAGNYGFYNDVGDKLFFKVPSNVKDNMQGALDLIDDRIRMDMTIITNDIASNNIECDPLADRFEGN